LIDEYLKAFEVPSKVTVDSDKRGKHQRQVDMSLVNEMDVVTPFLFMSPCADPRYVMVNWSSLPVLTDRCSRTQCKVASQSDHAVAVRWRWKRYEIMYQWLHGGYMNPKEKKPTIITIVGYP
jgi:hypothetical protein